MSINGRATSQAVTPASPEQAKEPLWKHEGKPHAGSDSEDGVGRPRSARLKKPKAPDKAKTGFVIKEVGSWSDDDLAPQRPMKRLKRLSSPRRAEAAAHLEDDLQDETSEDEGDEEFGETLCSQSQC